MSLFKYQTKKILVKKNRFFEVEYSQVCIFGMSILIIFVDGPQLSGLRERQKHVLLSNEGHHVLWHILFDLRIHYGDVPSTIR